MAGPKINLHVLWTLSLYSLNYSESCIRLCLVPRPHYSAQPMYFESLGLSCSNFYGVKALCFLKPFTPEPPTSLLLLVTSSVLMVKDNFVCYLVQSEEIFQIIPEWTIQSRTPEKKAKNLVPLTRKISWKSCSTSHLPFLLINSKILKAFQKTLPTKIKPTKCPVLKRKKMR